MILTYLKIFLYLAEYHFMRFMAKILGWPIEPMPTLTEVQKKTLNNSVKSLLKRWKHVLKVFPESNSISSPAVHLSRYRLILKDLKVFLDRKNRKDSYDMKELVFDKNCPEYFKRNYHYQTDGYLTIEAAARYDHQIELLFLGLGHVMRKVAYSVLATILKGNENVLEFGAASGTSAHQFKLMYPNTNLDILEPGHGSLDYARKVYPHSFNEVFPEFMENFKSKKQYDCIFSCFVMHEIPVSYWDKLVASLKMALKDGGHLLIIDAQQNNDRPENQFALDQFAEDFFEPYFPEYRARSLEEYFQSMGFKLIEKNEVLFSKTLLFVK